MQTMPIHSSEVNMIIGVPKEIKTLEKRVGLTPAGAAELTRHGHTVWVCLLYTSPSPRDLSTSRMPSSA